jgi:hypothetical protein
MGMCRQLLKNNKVFKDTVIEVDKEMRKYTKLSMTETLETARRIGFGPISMKMFFFSKSIAE